MANYVSPGVYVIERDTSQYPASVNPSVVGLVGFASKGPVDKATLITNGDQLVSTFGDPSEDIVGQALEGALEILETTNSLYFIRCASSTAADASVSAQLGSCPAVVISATEIGVTSALYLKINGTDGNGTALFNTDKNITIPAGSTTTTEAITSALGGVLTDATKISAYDINGSAVIASNFAGSTATLSVTAYEDAAHTVSSSALFTMDTSGEGAGAASTAITTSGMTFDRSSLSYNVESLYPGAGYNYSSLADGSITGLSVAVTTAGGTHATLSIFEDGVASESFRVSLLDGTTFVEKAINTGEVNLKSNLIKGNLEDGGTNIDAVALANFSDKVTSLGVTSVNGVHGGSAVSDKRPRFVKFVQTANTSNKLVGGTNGIPASTDDAGITTVIKGAVTDTGKTGMQLLDNDLLNLGMAAVPGITNESVQNELITLAEKTKEFLAVVSPPYAIGSVQKAIDWSNGLDTTRSAAINSSYAAIYWPWVKVFSAFDGVDRWYDPSIYAIRQMAFTDDVGESWFAPAGFTRGRLTKPTDTEEELSQGDRDALYSDGNVINPIVNFPQQGITIFGQRTAQRSPSALDRVNVRRMMILIRKIILRSTRQFVFEPNDPTTWSQIEALTTNLIDPIARGRGISEYRVICDDTTNTPIRKERGELWCKVVIKPTKTAEIIVFELNLVNQSDSIS